MSLGKSLESNVVPVEVCKHGMVHIGNVVFHTVTHKLRMLSNSKKQRD